MVSTKGILALVVAIGVALGASFVINNFVLKREFDAQAVIVDIVIVSVILFAGSMVAKKVAGKEGISNPELKV